MIAIHLTKNSPKKPNAKFSIYAQKHKQGISWKMFQTLGIMYRTNVNGNIRYFTHLATKKSGRSRHK